MQPGPFEPGNPVGAPHEMESHPVFRQVKKFLGFILNEPSEELSLISDANKRKVCGEILSDVGDNVILRDPVLAVRKRLANYTTLTAYDSVLTKTPRESEFPGITGELRPRLRELSKVDPRLREFLQNQKAPLRTIDEMAELLRARGILYNIWARAYNVARIELGDWDKDKRRDWYGPYKIAQAIHCEYAYRRELAMAPNIRSPGKPGDGFAEFIAYGEFEKIILEGTKDPRLAWEERWQAQLGYPSPLAGLEL
jgi:hypothetical protein